MKYVFFHPRGQNVGGVYTLGCLLHHHDSDCLSVILDPEHSTLDGLDVAFGRVCEISLGLVENSAKVSGMIQKFLESIEEDIVLIPSYLEICYKAAIDCAYWLSERKRNVKILGFCHCDELCYYQYINDFDSSISGIVSVSGKVTNAIKKLNPNQRKKLYTLPYPVKKNCFPKEPQKERLKVAYVGRIQHYQKRVDRLVDLCEILCQNRVNLDFDIVGDGAMLDQLRSAFEERVDSAWVKWTFRGSMKPESIPKYLAGVDVLVLVSEFEGYPIIVQEAMAAGVCPVVMAIDSGIPEMIQSGQNGWITPQADTDAMAKLLKDLSENRGQLQAVSEAARNTAEKHWMIENYLCKFRNILTEVLEAPTPDFRYCDLRIPESVERDTAVLIEQIKGRGLDRLAVFGAGEFGRYLVRKLNELGCGIDLLVDTDELIWDLYIEGIKCENPRRLLEEDVSAIVIASGSFIEEIVERLEILYKQSTLPIIISKESK